MRNARWVIGGLWLLAISWFVLSRPGPLPAVSIPAGHDDAGTSLSWYKGNTHAHAQITLGNWSHGDSSPQKVARWYHDHGYHFLALTDHNRWSDGSELDSYDGKRDDFLLIPAMEITSDHRYPDMPQESERKIHSTALGVNAEPEWSFEPSLVSDIIGAHVDRTDQLGGFSVLNLSLIHI